MLVGRRFKCDVHVRFFGRIRSVPGGSIEKVIFLDGPTQSAPSAEHPSTSHASDPPPRLATDSSPRIYRAIWTEDRIPNFLLRGMRLNEAEEIEGPDGAYCIYRTPEAFKVPLAQCVKWFLGAKVQAGLERWAEGLKNAAIVPPCQ